jgi:hypothetical protein
MIYQTTDEDYYVAEAETAICADYSFIIDRYVLPIVTNEYLYELPDYVSNIRRITYRGRKLNPYSGTEQILSGSTPQRYSQGEPREYIYNFLGRKTIRFFPTPAETIAGTGDGWSGSVIREKCVVEFFRTPDTSDEYKRLPEWLRTQMCEDYAILQLAKMDNAGYDLKTIQRFSAKWNQTKENIAKIKSLLFRSSPKSFVIASELVRQRPARPQLPWNFGRIVE